MPTSPPESVAAVLGSLPDVPGVYLWKDGRGRVLYVGKAKRLRQRARSYFTSDHAESPKNRMLVRLIQGLETIVVRSESEALLLENNLIKDHKPRFNIQLRDDKSYPYVAVTVGEPFPRVLVVRRLDVPGARYFGPYTDVSVLRKTLRVIRRVFTVRSCHYDLPGQSPERPCLDHHIQRCHAPCAGQQSEADYCRMISDVLAFLEGRTVQVRTSLRERMDRASQRLEFERAAEIRNSIRWLDQLEQPQSVQVVGGGDVDAIGFARDGDDAVCVVMRVREGKVIGSEQRFLQNLAEEPDSRILSAFLIGHYAADETRARRALVPFQPDELDATAGLLIGTRLLVPHRGTNHRLVQLADQNARHAMESFRIESFETEERAEDPVYALGRDLGLTVLPRDLVCIDISTSQGLDTVGSLVWFEAGRPKKGQYRRFKIKGEGQRDDFAAVQEVVMRYFRRRLDESKPLPDLIVIDGGKGQLNAAHAALEQLGLGDFPLVSLAKREEEVFIRGSKESLRLSRRAPSLRLLQRARDEAHRFAVSYNRKRSKQRVVTSALLDIPGVGEKRRRLLLDRFGSLAGVRLATPEEIAALPGFSLALAERILERVAE
ncbi:MAG: excinuclease ABC subunit UvrC [Gemmatimonadota bacterium]|nr:MAG: excinuclease ABC subunit UvrC [Gemmatimonadota bacterium]